MRQILVRCPTCHHVQEVEIDVVEREERRDGYVWRSGWPGNEHELTVKEEIIGKDRYQIAWFEGSTEVSCEECYHEYVLADGISPWEE